MRWEALFADLQGQWDAGQRAEDDARIVDLAEVEMGRALLADRIRARRGASLAVRLRDQSERSGPLLDAAPAWLLLAVGERRCLVPVGAVRAAWPLGPVAPEPGVVERRLGIAHVLRAIAREGATVRVRTDVGDYRGRLVRVGADHLDVALDPGSGPSRAPEGRVTLAFSGLVAVEST